MTGKELPTLDVVIVNWNSGGYLKSCIESINKSEMQGISYRIIIVDNGSEDISRNYIDSLTGNPEYIIIQNNENKGFSAACNRGAMSSSSEYILFLNPDTVMNRTSIADALKILSLQENKKYGIAGIQLINEQGSVQKSCSRFPTCLSMIGNSIGLDRLFPKIFHPHFMLEWDHDETRAVDQVIGAFFLVRRCVYEELNGFDERYFVYYEDLDFAMRAKAKTWSSLYIADVRAMHAGGGSTTKVPATRLFYHLNSRVLFSLKHFGKGRTAILLLFTLFVEPFSRIANLFIRRDYGNINSVIIAYAKFVTHQMKLMLHVLMTAKKNPPHRRVL